MVHSCHNTLVNLIYRNNDNRDREQKSTMQIKSTMYVFVVVSDTVLVDITDNINSVVAE